MSFQNSAAMHSFGRKASIFLLLVILFSVPAVAQVAGGTFSGTVSDPSGGGIPKATCANHQHRDRRGKHGHH